MPKKKERATGFFLGWFRYSIFVPFPFPFYPLSLCVIMRSTCGLCVLALLATLVQSRDQLNLFSEEVYNVDPVLFSSDDLSSSQFFMDDYIANDDSAFADLSINDDTTFLFAENLESCSFDDDFQPSRKLRSRDNPSCPAGSSSNNPSVRLPNLDDRENSIDPNKDTSNPEKVQHKGFGYFTVCPSRSKNVPDWVVCGIQGFSNGVATWEYDVYDAELCMC